MFWRNPSAAFFNFALPLIFLALFGAIFSGSQSDLDVIVPGIAALSIVSTTFVALAMNGWDEGHAAWWLNLEANPDAVIRLPHQQPRLVRARPSAGDERDRLWERWVATDPRLDAYATRRSTETPVIVLEPRNRAA